MLDPPHLFPSLTSAISFEIHQHRKISVCNVKKYRQKSGVKILETNIFLKSQKIFSWIDEEPLYMNR